MEREKVLELFARDRQLAHQALFSHRHPNVAPQFHAQIVSKWHSRIPKVLTISFRGSAKSTIAEEAILIMALFKEFDNCF